MRFRFRWIFLAVCTLFLIYVIYVYFTDSIEELEPTKKKSTWKFENEKFSIPNDDRSKENEDRESKKLVEDDEEEENGGVNYSVHTFYYPWYGNPQFDNGSYYHWNHNILPGPGQKTIEKKKYEPPDDIGANFYPQLGCYSSRDPSVIRQHFEWIRSAGIGTVVISWYPPGESTDQGHSWDDLTPILLDAAHKERLKIAFHIEPYKNRNIQNLRENLEYLLNKYGSHPAFYRYRNQRQKNNGRTSTKPLFYIYDSYLISDTDWRILLRRGNKQSIRDTHLDSFMIGLLVTDHQKTTLATSGFDGYYTYFAANDFSYGSTFSNWRSISVSARRLNMIFIPCVGPGYLDESVRPWNRKNTLSRGENGEYYARAWQSAVSARPTMIGVTSFNEWHEGTQIEPAIPYSTDKRTYLDYSPLESTFYLKMTYDWVQKFSERSTTNKKSET